MTHSRRAIDPIAQLMQEHDTALLHLSSLNRATQAIAAEGFTEERFQKVTTALEFIEEEISVHNKSEEEALFPVLERYVEGPTALMREEHRQMKAKFVLFRKAVQRIERRPHDQAAAENLLSISRVIVQMFVNHIHKENHILFPLVQKFLTKDALREVARRML
jgi:hemerythrin-like domain-containing protein